MNGQTNGGAGTSTERVFRSHDRSSISVPELAAMQRGYLERLGAIVDQLSSIVRRPEALTSVIDSPSRDVIPGASAARWSVLSSKPFTAAAVHDNAGLLVLDLRSIEGNVRLQLTRSDGPVLLKTLIEAIGELAAASQ